MLWQRGWVALPIIEKFIIIIMQHATEKMYFTTTDINDYSGAVITY